LSPIERETKLTVSAEDYARIRQAGRLIERTDQLNVYLQDPARLHEQLGYFRVRFETNRPPVATLKIPVGWKGEVREMVEVERLLSEMGPALFPRPRRWVPVDPNVPEGFMEHFQAQGITMLRRLGWMRNHRCVLELPPAGTIELDRTTLPDGATLFEVEIENPSEERHDGLVRKVREIAPGASFNPVGKFSRFLEGIGLGPRPPLNLS
jgi:hypothetical protein